jgi:hypothetical protein
MLNGTCSNKAIMSSQKNCVPSLPESNEELDFVGKKMIEALGAKLTNSAGDALVGRNEKNWNKTALLRGRLYRLPGGSVGLEFTLILASEYDLLANSVQKSERPSMFGKLILQKDKRIKKSADIRRLIK